LDNTIRLWDPIRGDQIRQLEGHKYGASSVSWSANGKTLAASTEYKAIRLWQVATGKEMHQFGHDSVNFVAWSPDGKRMASAGLDSTIVIWAVDNDLTAAPRPAGGAKSRSAL
jgi:WD40 repeat protein